MTNDLAALIRAAEKHFRLQPGDLLADGGRYEPIIHFRQLTQLVARERGLSYYSIGKAFGYAGVQEWHGCGSSIKRNCIAARRHLNAKYSWWLQTKADLIDAWDDES